MRRHDGRGEARAIGPTDFACGNAIANETTKTCLDTRMKLIVKMALTLALCFGVSTLAAEENALAELKTQLQQLQQEFDRSRHEQQRQIEALTKKLEALTAASPTSTSAATSKSAAGPDLTQQLAAELGTQPTTANPPARGSTSSAAAAYDSNRPAVPVARAGSTYMNVSYGTLIDAGWSSIKDPSAQLQLGDHDPAKRGFSLRNAEIAFDGAVDPYFQGFANIVLKLDHNNQTEIELEESFLQSTSLPGNLQLKAGQYFANFGRQNSQHPHTWSFVDQPIILGRMFGPDGLRSIGAQLSWLAPTPFYTELFLSVLDGQGGTAFSFRNPGEPDASGVARFAGRATVDRPLQGGRDLLFVPRIAFSTELTDTQTLLAGFSGAFAPNATGPDNRTTVVGADLYWRWKPANATNGFPFVSWQTEALYRRFSAAADPLAPLGLPSENLRDYGWYSQLLYGFAPRWNAGLRADFVDGNRGAFDSTDPFRGKRHRISPELTFRPSEFSKVRLQYNYDEGDLFGTAHSLWLRLEFGLGAHGAHKY